MPGPSVCPASPVPVSWCVSTVQDLSIGSCCEFRVGDAPDMWKQPSLFVCCQIKHELSIGGHKCYLLCSSPCWPCCVSSGRCYGQSLSLRLNSQPSAAPELWSSQRSHYCIGSAYPSSTDSAGDALWGNVYYSWWARNVVIYLYPSWLKICMANLVKHSSGLHCAAVAFGLWVQWLPWSVWGPGEMSCKCPVKWIILKGLVKCSWYFKSSVGILSLVILS